MSEHIEFLNGNIYNGLEVIDYDREKSKKCKKPYYICKCKICNKEASYNKQKLIKGECSCSCTQNSIEKMRLTRLQNGKEKANQYIGYINGKSKIIRYNEEKSIELGNTTVDLICSGCNSEYSAPLSQVLRGKYKLCSKCNSNRNSSAIKNIPKGEEFGDYIVNEFDHTENGRSYWNCYSMSRKCDIIVSYDTMYQSRRNKYMKEALKTYKENIKKVPFVFIDK